MQSKEVKIKKYGWFCKSGFNRNGSLVAISDEKGEIDIWQLPSGEIINTLKGFAKLRQKNKSCNVFCLEFEPTSSNVLAVGGWNSNIQLWDVNTGKLIKTINTGRDQVADLKFSPDGKFLVPICYENEIEIWSKETTKANTLKDNAECIITSAYHPDGKILATGDIDCSIKVWDIESQCLIRRIKGHSEGITSLCFSPDGQWLVSGSNDSEIKIWDITTGSEIKKLKGHSETITHLEISKDGKHLASSSDDSTIRVWNLEKGTWEEIQRFATNIKFSDSSAEYSYCLYSYSPKHGLTLHFGT
jgi:WD40 repeat protein